MLETWLRRVDFWVGSLAWLSCLQAYAADDDDMLILIEFLFRPGSVPAGELFQVIVRVKIADLVSLNVKLCQLMVQPLTKTPWFVMPDLTGMRK